MYIGLVWKNLMFKLLITLDPVTFLVMLLDKKRKRKYIAMGICGITDTHNVGSFGHPFRCVSAKLQGMYILNIDMGS